MPRGRPHNYAAIEVDDSKDPADYHYTERRAELLEAVLRAGGPRRVNQSQAADRYGVSRQQVHEDMKAIAESVAETIGDDIEVQVESAFDRIFDELMAAEEWDRAWRVVESYTKLLTRIGAVEEEPSKVDITTREAANETDEYVFIDSDATVETNGETAEAEDA